MNAPAADDLDAQDMQRLAAGEEIALNSLMERHAKRLFHYLIRCLQNEEEAADLAQETFVKVYQNRARFKAPQRFTPWLYAIAGNMVKDRYRWRSRHPQVSLDAENNTTTRSLADAFAQEAPSPTDNAQADERAEAVRLAVAELPDDLRQPLILAEYEEHSHAEIGAILGCSAKAVENRIYRARQQLRNRLNRLLEPV